MNTNHSDNNEDLLGKYLAQETNAQENALVEKWLTEDKNNQKELDDYTFIWNQVGNIEQQNSQTVNVDAAWEKVKSKMSGATEAKVVRLVPARRSIFTPISIAASVTVLLAIGFLTYFLRHKEPEIISLKTGQTTLQKTLPDGSVVFLNTNTTLTYPVDFEGDTREINLTGEAFFDVHRNEAKPFVIHANGSDIQVLGTSFNVKAYNKNVQVSVESGKVQFSKATKQAILTKGEQAEFEAETDTIKKMQVVDKNAFAYKTKVFVFENSSLEHIAKVLADGYHADISLNNSQIKSCRLTTRFDNETLPNALNIIAETLNLTVTAKGEKYILDGEGCK
ncbi:FecR family protein [Emticicia sp. 17c]|uniref:FecR family protein n=1 Tax=Emticicia sp. 17c TaxID=3127704 RepID=UPI00301C5B45